MSQPSHVVHIQEWPPSLYVAALVIVVVAYLGLSLMVLILHRVNARRAEQKALQEVKAQIEQHFATIKSVLDSAEDQIRRIEAHPHD